MLKVPSVDAAVAYWKETANAQVTASSQLDDSSNNNKSNDNNDENKEPDKLRSAFVVLGNGKTIQDCFALELVRNKHNTFELGNAVSYLGVSKLIQFSNTRDDLMTIMTATKTKDSSDSTTTKPKEPNGIPVVSCASAPGDFLARFCLHTTNIKATTAFYTKILGMKVAAIDDKMLCLRYPLSDNKSDKEKDTNKNKSDAQSSFYGVPTTLVFEPLSSNDTLHKGNCFDHIVVKTLADMGQVWEQLQDLIDENSDEIDCSIFMKPTEMFGQKVIGLLDPNGYKVILAGKV